MPVLKTSEVFSPEAQKYISEFGAKAGLLRMIRESVPKLTGHILDGQFITSGDILDERLEQIAQSIDIQNPLFRSTHPDDGVGYIGRLGNYRNMSDIEWENNELTEYAKRLGYISPYKRKIYVQKGIPYETGSVIGSLVEHPHMPGVYYISGRKRLSGVSTFAGVSSYGLNPNEEIMSLEKQKMLVSLYEQARETGFMLEEYVGQMEYIITPDGKITIFQVRAFREKQKVSWSLGKNTNNFSYVFGITPENGEEVTIRTYEDIPLESYNDDTFSGIHLRDEYRGSSVHPNFPLENMKLITANPRLSPFEHGLFEAASLGNIAIFSILGLPKIPDGKDLRLRVFSDGRAYKIQIQE